MRATARHGINEPVRAREHVDPPARDGRARTVDTLAAGCETPPRDGERRFVMASDLEKAWRRATALAPEHALALPFTGEHVAVIGTGLAAGVARAYAALREDASQGRTDAPSPDDVPRRTYHRTVLLSHSGDEPAMIELVEWLRSEAILAIAVGVPRGSPLDELAGTSIPLIAVDGVDGVGGPEAAHALTAFAVLRHHLLAYSDFPSEEEPLRLLTTLAQPA